MKMALALLALVVIAAIAVSGCGVSALEAHTESALIVREALNTSGNMIHDDMHKRAIKAASDKTVDTATAELNAHNVIRTYNPVIKLHGDAITVWQLWVTSLLSAYKDDVEDTDVWRRLAANAFAAYKDLAVQALRHDLKLPSILVPMKTALKTAE